MNSLRVARPGPQACLSLQSPAECSPDSEAYRGGARRKSLSRGTRDPRKFPLVSSLSPAQRAFHFPLIRVPLKFD